MSEDEHNGTSSICSEAQICELEFIKKYEQLKELWDPKHPDYTNKYKRNASLDVLKELRKHLASRKIGPDGEEIYEYMPTTWKFQYMRFVDRIERPHFNSFKGEVAQINLDDCLGSGFEDQLSDQESENSEQLHESNDCFDEMPIHHTVTIPAKRKSSSKAIKEETEGSFTDVTHTTSDKEYEAIGANVACKLKRMNPQQRYQAELLINKVLIKGLKNGLSDDTDLTDVWTG